MSEDHRHRRRRRVAACLVLLLVLGTGVSIGVAIGRSDDSTPAVSASGESPTTVTSVAVVNPVVPDDFADPVVRRTPVGYVALATGTPQLHLQRSRSTNLADWTAPEEALPDLPPWVNQSDPQIWAPAVLEADGRAVVVFAGKASRSGRHCLGVASAVDLGGPFEAQPTPLLCDDVAGGVIDPFVFTGADATWLLWKTDGNCCGKAAAIWTQRLDPRNVTLTGDPTKLLTVSQPWERGATASQTTVEAPAMVDVGDRLYLFYSGNGYDTPNYAMGYARCDSPIGPCSKPRSTPILASAGRASGPGGGDLFQDPDERWWIAYHGWATDAVGYRAGGVRSMRIDRVLFDGDLVTIQGPTTGS